VEKPKLTIKQALATEEERQALVDFFNKMFGYKVIPDVADLKPELKRQDEENEQEILP
jgi:hypothetical protein